MSSDSEDDHSSSSEKYPRQQSRIENDQGERSRSRSRDKLRKSKRSDDRTTDRQAGGKTLTIKIPELTGYLVPLSSFMKNQTDKINTERLKKAYNKYKSDWEAKQNDIFLLEHATDAWFLQRYDPDLRDQAEKDRTASIRSIAAKFTSDLSNGRYQALNLTISEADIPLISEREDSEQISNNSVDVIVKESINVEAAPYFGVDIDKLTLFVKPIPTNIFKSEIREEAAKLPGFLSIHMSEPIKKQNFIRYCWLVFQDEQSFNGASAVLNGLCIKNIELTVSKSSSKNRRLRILKHYPKNRLALDCRTCYNLIKTLDEEEGVQSNPLTEKPLAEDDASFDLYLLYLRRVHAYDYFTAQQFPDERSLTNKIGMAGLRIVSEVQQYDIPTVLKKNQQQAQKRSEHVKQKKWAKDELVKLLDEDTEILNDRQAWKCRNCNKKFITSEFLLRHIVSKHNEDYRKVQLKGIQLSEKVAHKTYLNDENKITSFPLQPGKDDYKGDYDRGNRGRRGGFMGNRGRPYRHYQDLDDPNTGREQEVKGRSLVNFLDI